MSAFANCGRAVARVRGSYGALEDFAGVDADLTVTLPSGDLSLRRIIDQIHKRPTWNSRRGGPSPLRSSFQTSIRLFARIVSWVDVSDLPWPNPVNLKNGLFIKHAEMRGLRLHDRYAPNRERLLFQFIQLVTYPPR